MSRKLDEWQTRIKAVERQHSAARFAVTHLLDAASRDPTILKKVLEPRNLAEASADLEATYLVRLFAVFESGVRSFWRSLKGDRRTLTEHLLDGVASNRGIPHDWLLNAHLVRKYRNHLVHQQDEELEPVEIATARKHLCTFFSRLPPDW